jgi:hypothetical protein
MHIENHRLLIFKPDNEVEVYEGNKLPNPAHYPVGTWCRSRNGTIVGSGWIQLVQYTMPKSIAWEYYDADAPDLAHLTKYMKMMALVMP